MSAGEGLGTAAPAPPQATPAEADAAGPDVARRPLVELVPSGAARYAWGALALFVAAASFARFGWSGHALVGAAFMPALVLLAAIDLQHRVLPNLVVLPAAALVVVLELAASPSSVPAHLAAGAALAAFFLVLHLVNRNGLGMGDVKMGLLIGVGLGRDTAAGMVIALLAVFLFAVGLIATQGLSARRKSIAFGPFLAFGGILAYLLS